MTVQSKIAHCARQFKKDVPALDLDFINPIPIHDVRTSSSDDFASWRSQSGVYYFVLRGKLRYVGRALRGTGLLARMKSQSRAYGGRDGWDHVIKNRATKVGAIVVSDDDLWYMAAALEAFLIARLKPKPQFNKRDS